MRLAPAMLLLVLSASCSDTLERAKRTAARIAASATQLDSIALAEAGAVASSRLAVHFAGEQGFSRTKLRERADWFTDSLAALLHADMNDPSGDLGYLDFDPFTGAQDDVPSYRLLRVRASADTVYAEFATGDGAAIAARDATSDVTFALVRSADHWRIADILNGEYSLVLGIRDALAAAGR